MFLHFHIGIGKHSYKSNTQSGFRHLLCMAQPGCMCANWTSGFGTANKADCAARWIQLDMMCFSIVIWMFVVRDSGKTFLC